MNFAEEIRKIRLSNLLTQEEFAGELGVTPNTVTRWETGKIIPGIKGMKQIDAFCKKHDIGFDVASTIINGSEYREDK